jgi:uncharacterized protein (TIGR02145 family)
MLKDSRIAFIFISAMSLLLLSCNSTTSELLPTVNTENVIEVIGKTATCGGTIVSDGGSTIITCGVCWNTKPEPTIKGNKTIIDQGIGSFVDSITNLSSATTYYVRAYATNANGTAYGSVLQITIPPDSVTPNNILNPTLKYDSITDIDGNKYHTIKIGTQTWMAENLHVTKYSNGDAILNETNNTKWNALTSGAQCAYNNNTEGNSIAKFGRLYNFYAVTDSRNIAPVGWHVASDAEWTVLTNYIAANLGTSTSVAQAMAASIDWTITLNDTIKSFISGVTDVVGYMYTDPQYYTFYLNNSSGFCGLPSGGRYNYGVCKNVGDYTAWWTTTQSDNGNVWFRSLSYYGSSIGKNFYNKQFGLSVRCVKD